MLSTFLNREEPPAVGNDVQVIEAERDWKDAQAKVDALRPRYEALRRLVNLPANQSLADVDGTPEQQDEAFGVFPDVAKEFHRLNEAERTAQRAYAAVYTAAKQARIDWYE